MVDKSIAEDTTATVPLGEAALVDDNHVHNTSLPIGDSQAAAMLVDNEVGDANDNLANANVAAQGSTVRMVVKK